MNTPTTNENVPGAIGPAGVTVLTEVIIGVTAGCEAVAQRYAKGAKVSRTFAANVNDISHDANSMPPSTHVRNQETATVTCTTEA